MAQVWKDRTCANDKYNPLHNNCKQREERQGNNMEIKTPFAIFSTVNS